MEISLIFSVPPCSIIRKIRFPVVEHRVSRTPHSAGLSLLTAIGRWGRDIVTGLLLEQSSVESVRRKRAGESPLQEELEARRTNRRRKTRK